MTNKLFLIYGPSGSGQDSVIEGLEKLLPIERIITSTTRPMRNGESDGHPYHFISKETFEEDLRNGKFLEYAKHYGGEYYGVQKEEVERVRNSEKVGIWKVDWQGVQNIKKIFPKVPAILITAPIDTLEKRLRRRDPERSESSLQERMAYSKEYAQHLDLHDFVVENSDGKLSEAIQQTFDIVSGKSSC